MLEAIFFYLFSFGAIGFALGVILSRSAVYSLLSLVACMCMITCLFVLLKAYLVAVILILVYAGAILVLFLFVVMLVDFRNTGEERLHLKVSPLLAALVGALFFMETLQVIKSLSVPTAPRLEGTVKTIGLLLFTNYVLPFELTSFLILAAIVSVVVLAKKGF